MRKIYKELTEEQRQRNVIFSSCLSVGRSENGDETTHEIKQGDSDANEVKQRLLNDSFFNKSPFNFNIIRE